MPENKDKKESVSKMKQFSETIVQIKDQESEITLEITGQACNDNVFSDS
jgi:hypothetical protein